jgi:hypothetical protein
VGCAKIATFKTANQLAVFCVYNEGVDHLTKAAINHTLHCLLGCSIGEILGVVVGTALGWSNFGTIVLAIVLAFFFGYLLTFQSVYRKSKDTKVAFKTALATDTTSITTMEIMDNAFILLVPGAMNANIDSGLFWGSLFTALAVAFVVTVPVNRFMIARSGHMHHH